MQTVGQFHLDQEGGYVCDSYFIYLDNNGQMQHSSETSNQLLGQQYTINPGDLGVPDGSTLWLALDVKLGKDVQAQQGFTYQNGAGQTANYTSSGAAWSPSLALNGVN